MDVRVGVGVGGGDDEDGETAGGRGGKDDGAELPAEGAETGTTCTKEEGMPFSWR